MRKRIVCLLLALVLALPLVLASCNRETPLVDKPAPVFTLYCITANTTTPEAITRVEYEINRVLFYRIGSIVKLELVTADKYEELIESKMEEIKAYKESAKVDTSDTSGANASDSSAAESSAAESSVATIGSDTSGTASGSNNGKNTLVNTAKLTHNAQMAGYSAMSGEAILNDLAAGIEIELECPRLDLFLVTDYDSYLKLAEDGKLAALDTVLNNEAKAIKSYVHSSFFNAAKVGNKTYGVPCNTTIGEYTYIVFNKDVLEESGVAQETLYTLEDLADFLAIVKEQHPEVVPLANSVTPASLYYMFEDGFPAYVNHNGYVLSTYEDATVNEYLTMLTRYSALGYFQNNAGKTGEDEKAPFAVKFISGTKEEMDALAKENNYVYNRYSVPIATSENSIDSIYCLANTDYCPSSWQTDAMEVLTELYTDEGLQNLFLYGVENENYRLENNIPVVYRLNQEYVMSPAHTGNCFIAYVDGDAGDSLTKWTDARDQNIDAVESKTIGFTFEPKEFTFTRLDKNGLPEEFTISEPDYETILWNIIKPYYTKLTNGTAIEFDYDTTYAEADAAARESIREELLSTYEKRLQLKYTGDLAQQIPEEYGEQFRAEAEKLAKAQLVDDFDTNSRRRKLTNQLADENPDASDEEIEALLEALLKDPERLWENYRTIVRSDDQWNDQIEEYYEELIDEKLEAETERVLSSSAYLSELNNIPNTEAFQADYTYALEVQVVDTVKKNLDAMISELIKEYCAEIIAACEEALEEAIDAFAEKYAAAAKEALKAIVRQQVEISYQAEKLTKEQLDQRAKDMLSFIEANAGLSDDKVTTAINRLFTQYYGELETEALKAKYDPWKKDYEGVYLPAYSQAYNEKNQALFEIGYLNKDALTIFGKVTEEEGTEGTEGGTTDGETGDTPETPEDEEPTVTPGAYDSYYHFVFTAKLKGAYYAQFGEPGK